jgi:chorismate mutase / prephenate dehydrogenase
MSCEEYTLQTLRRRLDEIDRRLLALVAERKSVIGEVARVKQMRGIPTRDIEREREVILGARSLALELRVSPALAEELARLLIRSSLTDQEQTSVQARGIGVGRRALVIGGGGRMGRWFAVFLAAQGFAVEVADPSGGPPGIAQVGDWRDSDLQHDYIVLATPIVATNVILCELATHRPAGVVFDICSVKAPLYTGMNVLRLKGWKVTSVHPLFGPDTELLSGRHVLFVDLQCAAALQSARELFASTMVEQVVMSLEDHDRLVAYVFGLPLAVSIAFSAALTEAGGAAPEIGRISGTAFDALLDAATRFASESPQVHYEMRSLNSYATESLTALVRAMDRVQSAIASSDAGSFTTLMRRLRSCLEERRTLRQRRALPECDWS